MPSRPSIEAKTLLQPWGARVWTQNCANPPDAVVVKDVTPSSVLVRMSSGFPMKPRLPVTLSTWPLALVICASVGPDARSESLQPADARQERLRTAVGRVYDTNVLHRIEIVIAPEDARTILNRTTRSGALHVHL